MESGLIGLVLVLGAIAVTLATGFLMLDNERLRWGNWKLEGAQGRPPKTMEAWTQWVVVAGFLLPCAGVVVIPQLLALVRVAPAVARETSVVTAPPPRALVQTSVPNPATPKAGEARDPATGDCEPIPPSRLHAHLESVARQERVPVDLLEAVIYRESLFRPCAVSRSGAMGMMQLMPGTAADLGVSDPFDPEQNIRAGARFLRRLLTRYDGDVELALAAYHAGPRWVDVHHSVPAIRKTQVYVRDIVGLLAMKP